MEILGIGPLELFFILIIALIVLGPNDMVKAGRILVDRKKSKSGTVLKQGNTIQIQLT